ncbi:MAG: hypothetical protein LUC91_07450, partial [Prevotella sp.]|nr:hypothetical protein [Prevotella sp.]
GKGSGTNEWFQLYMSFVNKEDVDYDYYTVKIDNCCASTDGGDFYLDEISVYVLHPSVQVEQIEPVCSGDDETKGYAPIRLNIDYESLMGCFGLNSSDYNGDDVEENDLIEPVDFIIFNKYKYDNYIASGLSVSEALANSIDSLYYIKKSTDENGYEVEEGVGTAYPTLSFYLTYSNNEEYEEETSGTNFPYDGYLLYRRTDSSSGLDQLAVDFYGNISAYTPYMIVLRVASEEETEDKAAAFANLLETSYECAAKSDFYVTSTTKIRVNGEITDPSETLCMNQVVHIEPQGTYNTIGEDNEVVTNSIDGECFDWFVGTEDEYVEENEEFGNESVKSALLSYRLVYPTESSLAEDFSTYEEDPNNTDGTTDDGTDESNLQFTENQYNLLQYYIEKGKIALYKQSLDVHVPETGLVLVIQPIQMDYNIDDENAVLCFGYVPLVLTIDGQSPSLNMGFSTVLYPSDYTPSLRLGLDQLKKATKAATDESESYCLITVNLKDASYVVDDDVEQAVDHIGPVNFDLDVDSVDYAKLYLIGTNDPDYVEAIEADNFGTYELAVGEIKRLFAKEDNSSDTSNGAPTDGNGNGIGSYMQVYFFEKIGDDKNGEPFEPKEGCYYRMTVHFEEKAADGSTIASPCYGSFPLVLKVVPEYLVWQGKNGTENWNDDNNWKRADRGELKKSGNDYPTNEENKTSDGYVPMLFSKVVMPKDSKAELYMAGFAEKNDTIYWAKEEEKPENIYPIEDNIMYDLMVYEDEDNNSNLTTKHYRVNLCDEIHFETGAQLAHAEQLMYNKAWVDVRIPRSQWTLVSLPLKDIYAGDWYTQTSGTEESEYFTDLKFTSDGADRSNPLVYQRSWDNTAKIVEVTNSTNVADTVYSYASTGWSSVYNDGAVPYAVGKGFSVKAYLNSSVVNDSLLFRFPKEDVSYNTTSEDLDKTGYGKLWISDYVDRTDPDNDGVDIYLEDKESIPVTYSLTSEGYCLVGNPFMTNMSIKQFIEENGEYISDYWIGTSNGPIAGNATYNSEGTSDYLVPPYGAFYAVVDNGKLDKVKSEGLILNFTKEMQDTLATETASLAAFSIRAMNSSGRSSAAFYYSENATDGYDANEDAILLEDASWKKSGMPFVYTVAGDKAVSVNSLKEQRMIPLGVFADDGSSYTLTFVGVDNV